MVEITFITPDGESITLEAEPGCRSLMELAKDNDIPGIEGECGGVCSCATCHVHVDPEQLKKTGEAGETERDMLELEDNATEYSRLSCQIEISDKIDGLVVKVAH